MLRKRESTVHLSAITGSSQLLFGPGGFAPVQDPAPSEIPELLSEAATALLLDVIAGSRYCSDATTEESLRLSAAQISRPFPYREKCRL